jgi:hypothetical protein
MVLLENIETTGLVKFQLSYRCHNYYSYLILANFWGISIRHHVNLKKSEISNINLKMLHFHHHQDDQVWTSQLRVFKPKIFFERKFMDNYYTM